MAYRTKFDGTTDTTIKLGGPGNPTSIEGYFLGTRDIPDQGYGPGKLHIFQTQEGSVGVWGKTNSNRLLTPDIVGQMVLLTFTGMGEKKKGKNPAYNYSVQHDPENTMDVTGINVNSSEPEGLDDETDGGNDVEETAPVVTAPRPKVTTPSVAPKATIGGGNSATQAKLQEMLNKRKSA